MAFSWWVVNEEVTGSRELSGTDSASQSLSKNKVLLALCLNCLEMGFPRESPFSISEKCHRNGVPESPVLA